MRITLEPCPLGFELNRNSRACDCDENLGRVRGSDRAVVECEIQENTGYITRKGTVWVGMDTHKKPLSPAQTLSRRLLQSLPDLY